MDPRELADEVNRMRPAERLRFLAEAGARIRSLGPVEHDFNEFVDRLVDIGVVDDSGAHYDQMGFREQMHTLHFTGRWAHYGFNVFELTTDLAAGFLLTEPPPTEDELQLPFPCFFIKLPEGVVPVFAHGRQDWAEGIWVHRFVSMHREEGNKTDFFRWSVVKGALSVWKDRFPKNLDDPTDESTFSRTMWGDPPIVPEDQITTDKALRVIKNLVSWLDATGGLAEHPKPQPPPVKRKASHKRKEEREKGIWPRVWLFGQNVKLQPELRRMAREVALGQSSDHAVQGWKVRIKHVVRGHWKNQPHGEGRTQRKRKWIEPYWRGPEGAAAWAHLYEAGEKNDG